MVGVLAIAALGTAAALLLALSDWPGKSVVSASTPTAENPLRVAPDVQTSDLGHVMLEVGELAQIVDAASGAVLFELTVRDVAVADSCAGEFATVPENGQYVVVDIQASMPMEAIDLLGDVAPEDAVLSLGPASWSLVDDRQRVESQVETDRLVLLRNR